MNKNVENISSDVETDNYYFESPKYGVFGDFVKAITCNHNVTLFEAEENFRMEPTQIWFQETMINTYFIVGIYLLVIFGGKYWMKGKERFELQKPLILWNFGLALFSIMGAIRVIPELLDVLFNRSDGFYQSVCTTGYFENRVLGFWNVLFVFSKLVELGDTVFIVLRKQPLIFLHWYHHVTVLILSWSTGADCSAPSRWYSSLNYLIHSFMYSYYGLRALKIRVPKPIAAAITSSQLIQMITGVIVILAAFMYKKSGRVCEVSDRNLNVGMFIYTSYWVLFANFFYKVYLNPRSSKTKFSEVGEKKKDS